MAQALLHLLVLAVPFQRLELNCHLLHFQQWEVPIYHLFVPLEVRVNMVMVSMHVQIDGRIKVHMRRTCRCCTHFLAFYHF